MRQALVVVLLALAACSGAKGAGAESDGEPIFCALGGASEFKPDCRLERETIDQAATLVIRHPDGEFHRLQVSPDGQQLLAADGAEGTQSARKGDRYEVILGANRYVIPVAAPARAKGQ